MSYNYENYSPYTDMNSYYNGIGEFDGGFDGGFNDGFNVGFDAINAPLQKLPEENNTLYPTQAKDLFENERWIDELMDI